MIRGTTAKFKFEIPYDFNDVETIDIMFWQNNNNGPTKARSLPIKKNKNDCTWLYDYKQIVVTLQPEETARFVDDRKAIYQLNGTTISGITFGTKELKTTVYPMRIEEPEWGEIIPPSPDEYSHLDGGQIIT